MGFLKLTLRKIGSHSYPVTDTRDKVNWDLASWHDIVLFRWESPIYFYLPPVIYLELSHINNLWIGYLVGQSPNTYLIPTTILMPLFSALIKLRLYSFAPFRKWLINKICLMNQNWDFLMWKKNCRVVLGFRDFW